MNTYLDPKWDSSPALPCFLTGLGVGVALMAIFAPHSGAHNRRTIRHKLKEGRGCVKDQAGALQDCVIESVKDVASEIKEAS